MKIECYVSLILYKMGWLKTYNVRATSTISGAGLKLLQCPLEQSNNNRVRKEKSVSPV
jgi:hypothetical protein